MPVTKSAKKALKQDRKRQERNSKLKATLKEQLKKTKKNPTQESVRLTTKVVDKAAKSYIIHKNKASRIKSTLSKLLATVSDKKSPKATKH